MLRQAIPVGAALLMIAGCSGDSGERVGGGGVETGDLTVVVADADGAVLVGARVWLVDDAGDSSEAVALDSGSTSEAGSTLFDLLAADVGIEAWSGDTLAALDRGRVRLPGDSVSLFLERPLPLSLDCRTFSGMEIRQPGSRRIQRAPASCVDSFVVQVVAPARILRAVPLTGPKRPTIIILDSARYGSGRKGPGGGG